MIRTPLNLKPMLPFDRTSAALVAHTASRFESRLTLETDRFILNAKSMLGLLSQPSFGDGLCELVADGPDEGLAVESLLALFRH